jgi:ATP-dependent DNA helicase RecG
MDKLTSIKGIGEKTEQMFMKLGISNVQELVEYYPRNYDICKEPIDICEIQSDNIQAVYASIASRVDVLKNGKRTITKTIIRDSTGEIQVKWFNMPFLKNTLRIGQKFIFRGLFQKVRDKLIVTQPEIITIEDYQKRLYNMQPIYPLTKGITNKTIISAEDKVLNSKKYYDEFMPDWIIEQCNLAEYDFSIRNIHFPKDEQSLHISRERLAFDEFLLFQLGVYQLKEKKNLTPNNYVMKEVKDSEKLIEELTFELTGAQKRVLDEISKDLSGPIAMNRLIQGDVGSGKTVIAAIAMFVAAKNGYQATIMAPTEVLAKQHLESLAQLYSNYNIRVDLLVGSMTSKEKKLVYEKLRNGEIDILVGTHAIIQEKVEFLNLALVITDEQHRFGVRQRESLSTKSTNPHILVMSATPIPRTLAIIVYGDLDISIVDELPPNRQKIKNCVVNKDYRPKAYEFIYKEVGLGRQAYIVCSMVEQSEEIEAEAVIDYVDDLKKCFNDSINIEYLHGKMKPKLKNEIMYRFAKNEIQVLVSTTVIEVGVNVPNATVMMVENAERFGLAQLHQLRGRVGRGKHQSYCILINCKENKKTKERLEVLNNSNDGFYIAEEDLRLRGPGDFFGVRQSGQIEFRLADMFQDINILKKASDIAKQLIYEDRELEQLNNFGLKEKVVNYLSKNVNNVNI